MFRLKLQFLAVSLMLGFNVLAADPLPRVLVLGDVFYQNMVGNSLAQALKGRAQAVYVSPGDTSYALAHFDELLGKDKPSVIYFNFGHADLCYKHPNLKEVRALSKAAGGVRVSSPEVYEKNLNELVRRFKATGAKLIWGSTIPVPAGMFAINADLGSEVEYNAIAAKVMSAQNVAINDISALGGINPKSGGPTPSISEAFLKAIMAALEPVKQ